MPDGNLDVYDSITSFHENAWDNLVHQSSRGDIFQTYGWMVSIEQGTELSPKHLVLSKGGNPIAIWPNFVGSISVPKVPGKKIYQNRYQSVYSCKPGYGGFIVPNDENSTIPRFIEILDRSCEGTVINQILRLKNLDFLRYSHLLQRVGFSPSINLSRFIIDLTKGWEQITDDFASSRRKDLRQIARSDISVTTLPITKAHLSTFHDRYEETVRNAGGSPYPESFFLRLAANINDRMQLFSAEFDGETIGQHLYLLDRRNDEIHSIFGGIPDQDHTNLSAATALHFDAIKWGIDHEYERYDFGGMASDHTDGLFRYKDQFGGHLQPAVVWERGISPIKWRTYRLAKWLYQRR